MDEFDLVVVGGGISGAAIDLGLWNVINAVEHCNVITRMAPFDETVPEALALSTMRDLSLALPGVPGALGVSHPGADGFTRVYLGWSAEQSTRFAGAERQRRFLDCTRAACGEGSRRRWRMRAKIATIASIS